VHGCGGWCCSHRLIYNLRCPGSGHLYTAGSSRQQGPPLGGAPRHRRLLCRRRQGVYALKQQRDLYSFGWMDLDTRCFAKHGTHRGVTVLSELMSVERCLTVQHALHVQNSSASHAGGRLQNSRGARRRRRRCNCGDASPRGRPVWRSRRALT
jgi:hypothetical protein